jgi:queuine/archaeosine tRNA-ribosyltransferase
MRHLFILLVFIMGCATPRNIVSLPADGVELVDCTDVLPMTWGKRGEDPSKNTVWKCNDWELKAQE